MWPQLYRQSLDSGLAPSTSDYNCSTAAERRSNRTIGNPLLLSLVVVLWLCVGVCGMSNQECLGLFDTHAQGVYVCYSHRDLVPALQIAEELGRRECQEAFKMERWNCSNFSILKAPNITKSATKEAAYVHALSFAAIAHSVAKVCAQGGATSCSCDEDNLDLPETNSDTEYKTGCSDNVGFGIQFARTLLQTKRYSSTGRGLKEDIAIHNMAISAKVVEDLDQVPYVCRCIGISGSCTVQTCQYELPEFGVLANRIQDFYFKNNTCQVEWNHIIGENSAYVPVNPDDDCDNHLKFSQNSPDYCVQNNALGSPGTSGRECDPHSDGPNSCNYLCTQCGRNHIRINEETEDDCWCEFVFCCEIRCRRCPVNRQYHICT